MSLGDAEFVAVGYVSTGIVEVQHLCGTSGTGTPRREVPRDDSARSDRGLRANLHILNDTYRRTDIYIIPDDRRCVVIGADIQELAYIHIVAYDGVLIDHDADFVTDVQPITYPRRIWDVNLADKRIDPQHSLAESEKNAFIGTRAMPYENREWMSQGI